MTKPAGIAYDVNDRPPASLIAATAVQHVGVIVMFLIYPVVIGNRAGLNADELLNILQLAMIVMAFAVLVQGLPSGPIGSRFLAPSIFTGAFLVPSMIAVKAGGMPLVWGMTMFAGAVQVFLSRIWTHLRAFIPPEATGLVMSLIGIIIAIASLNLVLEHGSGSILTPDDCIVAAATLAVMISLNIWNSGKLKLMCVLIGALAGYAVAYFIGQITAADIQTAMNRPAFALPHVRHLSWSFDWSMAVPFAISALAAAMSATAVITTYQRLNDADWIRPEPASLTRGLLGEGIANMVSGALGAVGLTISTANVGLVAATGVTSRVISFAISGLLAILAFQPVVIGLFTIMPHAVMAAVLIFTAAFIFLGGINIVSSRPLDHRRTLVVGMGFLTFILVTVAPAAFTNAPSWAQPMVTSPLVLATFVALALNAVFRIGIRRSAEMSMDPLKSDCADVATFIENQTRTWAVRRDLVARAIPSTQQAVVSVIEYCSPSGPIKITASYDEFDIDIRISYLAPELIFVKEPPSQAEIITSEDCRRSLAGYLVARQTDYVKNTRGCSTILLRFKY